MNKSSMTFIVETTSCDDVNSLITEIAQLLTSKGYTEGLSFISNDGKSGSLIFTCPAEPVDPEDTTELEVTLASDSETPQPADSSQQTHSDLLAHAVGLGHIPADIPADIPAQPEASKRAKSGIVFVKSLLPAEPVPYKCDIEKECSELHVRDVAYQHDLVTFSYRNTVFKFPIEQDKSCNDFVVIRVVLTLDNTLTSNVAYLKIIQDADDNHVVFCNSDAVLLGLFESQS